MLVAKLLFFSFAAYVSGQELSYNGASNVRNQSLVPLRSAYPNISPQSPTALNSKPISLGYNSQPVRRVARPEYDYASYDPTVYDPKAMPVVSQPLIKPEPRENPSNQPESGSFLTPQISPLQNNAGSIDTLAAANAPDSELPQPEKIPYAESRPIPEQPVSNLLPESRPRLSLEPTYPQPSYPEQQSVLYPQPTSQPESLPAPNPSFPGTDSQPQASSPDLIPALPKPLLSQEPSALVFDAASLSTPVPDYQPATVLNFQPMAPFPSEIRPGPAPILQNGAPKAPGNQQAEYQPGPSSSLTPVAPFASEYPSPTPIWQNVESPAQEAPSSSWQETAAPVNQSDFSSPEAPPSPGYQPGPASNWQAVPEYDQAPVAPPAVEYRPGSGPSVLIPSPSQQLPQLSYPLSSPSQKPIPEDLHMGDFQCSRSYGYYPVNNECDSYIKCQNHRPYKHTCLDGLHFNPKAIYPTYPCSYPSEVKCEITSSRQAAQPTKECSRRYGFFPLSGDCTKFFMCQEGKATIMNCPLGLVFNDQVSSCDWPENVPQCKIDAFKNFTCPIPSDEFQDSIYRYRYHDDCKMYVACKRGHPRLLQCDAGLYFDEDSQVCIYSDLVKYCETR